MKDQIHVRGVISRLQEGKGCFTRNKRKQGEKGSLKEEECRYKVKEERGGEFVLIYIGQN